MTARSSPMPALYAVWLDRPDLLFAEILAEVGVDVVILDGEHGAFSDEGLWEILGTTRALGLRSFVRVPELVRSRVMQPLDWGADAVIIPGIETTAQAAEAVGYAQYPPDGQRGWGPRRPALHRRAREDRTALISEQRHRCPIWVQIETTPAVESIAEISSIRGLGGILVGPNDLAGDLGVLDDLNHPALNAAIDKVVRTAVEAEVPVGVVEPAANEDRLQARRDAGCSLISVGTQLSMMYEAIAQRVSTVREQLSSTGNVDRQPSGPTHPPDATTKP